MKIETTGRTDINDYFKLSGVMSYKKLNHYPFIVFIQNKSNILAEKKLNELISWKEHYEYQASGKSSWAIEHKDDEMGKNTIKEAKEELSKILKQIKIEKEKLKLTEDIIEVRIIETKKELCMLPPETKVMAQWGGEYHSDFFQFTVEDIINYINENKIIY